MRKKNQFFQQLYIRFYRDYRDEIFMWPRKDSLEENIKIKAALNT